MNYTHSTTIVPAAHVALARELASTIAPGSGSGMWERELSPTGKAPATHYISSGLIQAEMAALLGDAPTTYAAAQQAGVSTTLQAIQALYAASTIRQDANPHEVIAELGLKFVEGEA